MCPKHHTNVQATFAPSLYYTESAEEAIKRARSSPLVYSETGPQQSYAQVPIC